MATTTGLPWSQTRRRRVAFIDAFSGVAGDMLLAAVLDAGCPRDELESGLRSLTAIAGALRGVAARCAAVRCLRPRARSA